MPSAVIITSNHADIRINIFLKLPHLTSDTRDNHGYGYDLLTNIMLVQRKN